VTPVPATNSAARLPIKILHVCPSYAAATLPLYFHTLYADSKLFINLFLAAHKSIRIRTNSDLLFQAIAASILKFEVGQLFVPAILPANLIAIFNFSSDYIIDIAAPIMI